MNGKVLTLIGSAVLLAAAIAFFALGGEDIAQMLVALAGGAAGGGLIVHRGIFGGSGGDGEPRPKDGGTKLPLAGEGGRIRIVLLLALVGVAFAAIAVLETGGCAPGYSTKLDDRAVAVVRVGSSGALKAAPAIVRLAGRGEWWSDPVASTIEAWTPAIMQAADAALTECVDPGVLVAQVLAAVAQSLAAWVPTSMDALADAQEVVELVGPIVVGAVEALWPYEVGHCPFVEGGADVEDASA